MHFFVFVWTRVFSVILILLHIGRSRPVGSVLDKPCIFFLFCDRVSLGAGLASPMGGLGPGPVCIRPRQDESGSKKPLLWCKGWGRKMPFVTTTNLFIRWTPPPSVNTKKRNRIMHVFLKFAFFMITLNFVYYYLCIIEIERTLFFRKHQFSYIFYELQNCSFSPPTFLKIRNEVFLTKVIKRKKTKTKTKEIQNNFPKLTYKDWDFFFSLPSYLESRSTWT